MFLTWIAEQHTHEENYNWCWARAQEWCWWPGFLSLTYVSVALLFTTVENILTAIVVINLLWCLIYKWTVNVPMSYYGGVLGLLRWPIAITAAAIGCWGQHNPEASFGLIWPLVGSWGYFRALLLGTLCGDERAIHVELMSQLGYTATSDGFSKDGENVIVETQDNKANVEQATPDDETI